jgi:hypothetical protein
VRLVVKFVLANAIPFAYLASDIIGNSLETVRVDRHPRTVMNAQPRGASLSRRRRRRIVFALLFRVVSVIIQPWAG